VNAQTFSAGFTTAHLHQFPSGTWGLVGRTPLSMKYDTTDSEILDAIHEKAKFGQVFGDGEATRRGITRLSFKTADEVRARAAALGIQVQE
jgi:hypothetical protein